MVQWDVSPRWKYCIHSFFVFEDFSVWEILRSNNSLSRSLYWDSQITTEFTSLRNRNITTLVITIPLLVASAEMLQLSPDQCAMDQVCVFQGAYRFKVMCKGICWTDVLHSKTTKCSYTSRRNRLITGLVYRFVLRERDRRMKPSCKMMTFRNHKRPNQGW